MTDDQVAAATVAVEAIETEARAHWDAIAQTPEEADEYKASMGVVRQAGALRRSLEQLIVVRATRAQRAAASR